MNWNPSVNRIKLWGLCLCATLVFSGASAIGSAPSAHAAASAASVTAQKATQTSLADEIIATGKQFIGVPYLFGARTGQTNQFDCSSFTKYIFAQHGITLPRTSKEQSTAGVNVARKDLQPGDLVFFYSPIHHVGIYIGNGKVLHTYGEPGVTITDLVTGWWDTHYATARRVIPASSEQPNQPAQPDQPEASQPDQNPDQSQQQPDNTDTTPPTNDWWNWFAGSRS